MSPARLTLSEWTARREALLTAGLREPAYGGPLCRHLEDGDLGLSRLRFDDSAAALRLWNFLLSEEDRLREARAAGNRLVGAMKDLGTVPVMAFALEGLTAFYPDGAWWIPCLMERSSTVMADADALGIGESFCPVRAMLGAFASGEHFPLPDLLVCSAGATCDDFSAVAQRVEDLGHPVLWWEIPHRRAPAPGETVVELPGGGTAPAALAALVEDELRRVAGALGNLAGFELTTARLAAGVRAANGVRRVLRELRHACFTSPRAPFPALELLIAEMLAIHFCSDREESAAVLADLLAEARRRIRAGEGYGDEDAVRVFWVNPVADLEALLPLEKLGGRLAGTDYLFPHAIDALAEDLPPLSALARAALADPMAGPAEDRAARICADARAFGAEAVVVSRIPGASHCATEGRVIAEAVGTRLGLPAVEIEVPYRSVGGQAAIAARLEALLEAARARRTAGRPIRASHGPGA